MQPPLKKRSQTEKWAKRKKFQLKLLPQYLVAFFLQLLSAVLKLNNDTIKFLRRSLEIGNPTSTVWPSEMIPMVSRMLAGGFWNFSFFQFHRNFYFPFWAQKQYDPNSQAFIPRSHNILSINQTQRNWVSISFPGKKHEVCVDPALALMPNYDTPTLEFAVFDNGKLIRPHDETHKIRYKIKRSDELECVWRKRKIKVKAEQNGVRITIEGEKNIIFSIRPFNMEGAAFIDKLFLSKELDRIEGDMKIDLSEKPDLFQLSNYVSGDSLKDITKQIRREDAYITSKLSKKQKKKLRFQVRDSSGMANASFFYKRGKDCSLFIQDQTHHRLPKALTESLHPDQNGLYEADAIWEEWFPSLAKAHLPGKFADLFFHARSHLLTLWDFDTITPGSFTYHHFWIRDAALILYALMLTGGQKPVRRIIMNFKHMVKRNGLFKSQTGEWDANGQALWVIGKYMELFRDEEVFIKIRKGIYRMLRWLDKTTQEYKGVLPPGFSAEHLGVADWYLWDNFWSMGGVLALTPFQHLLPEFDLKKLYERIHTHLNEYLKDYKYYPAALGRRKDAGMIGSICAVYPLNLPEFYGKKMLNTLKIIQKNYFFEGGFFQENIHSGINPYLTLQTAEALLHLGKETEAFKIFKNLLSYSSIAYTFPEAVHPHTKSGCMGDGFHGWAFAEIIIFIKNMFFLELPDKIILLAGIPESWFSQPISLTNLNTPYGRLSIQKTKNRLIIEGLRKEGLRKTDVINIYLALPPGLKKRAKGIRGTELKFGIQSERIWAAREKEIIQVNPSKGKIGVQFG